MKRFLVVVGVCLLAANLTSATPTVTVGRMPGTYFTPDWAGEYELTPGAELNAILASRGSFQSFCSELNAYVQTYPPTTSNVTVSDEIMSGGTSLTPKAAYLYARFSYGMLAGHDYAAGSGRADSARALQAAMWYVQGQDSHPVNLLNVNPAWGPLGDGSDEAEASDWTSIGGVCVLNLWSGTTWVCVDNQDMLGVIPLLPAPGTLALVGIGVALLGWQRRRLIC